AYVISRDFIAYKVDVAYQGEAMVEPKGKQKVTVEVTKTMPGPLTLDVSWRVPKGWKIAPAGGTLKFSGRLGRKRGGPKEEKGPVKKTFTITAGASVGRDCRCLLELVPRERLTAGLIQVPLLVQKKQK
ncbi:MAG: hypothetical protein QGD94_12885, partial [Planctomycetia bacterium]|nr:hypothetical protein [Planctomycetia bacterium]